MDETKTRPYQWIAANSSGFFWVPWGAALGAFLMVAASATGGVEILEQHAELVIAAFTIVLAVSTIGLWRATQGLWKGAEEQLAVARATADAAVASASAAQAAVEHARKSSEQQLRAYITINEHKAHNFVLEIGQVIVPHVTIMNRGQTLARNVVFSMAAKYDDADSEELLPLNHDPYPPFSLAPSEKSIMTADVPPLDEAIVNGLKSGKLVLNIVAEAKYEDVFGNERVTRIRAGSNIQQSVDGDGNLQLWWFGPDNDAT
jgi:hypothetical protein